jgi:hypothetical protein
VSWFAPYYRAVDGPGWSGRCVQHLYFGWGTGPRRRLLSLVVSTPGEVCSVFTLPLEEIPPLARELIASRRLNNVHRDYQRGSYTFGLFGYNFSISLA